MRYTRICYCYFIILNWKNVCLWFWWKKNPLEKLLTDHLAAIKVSPVGPRQNTVFCPLKLDHQIWCSVRLRKFAQEMDCTWRNLWCKTMEMCTRCARLSRRHVSLVLWSMGHSLTISAPSCQDVCRHVEKHLRLNCHAQDLNPHPDELIAEGYSAMKWHTYMLVGPMFSKKKKFEERKTCTPILKMLVRLQLYDLWHCTVSYQCLFGLR